MASCVRFAVALLHGAGRLWWRQRSARRRRRPRRRRPRRRPTTKADAKPTDRCADRQAGARGAVVVPLRKDAKGRGMPPAPSPTTARTRRPTRSRSTSAKPQAATRGRTTKQVPNVAAGGSAKFAIAEVPAPKAGGPCHVQVLRRVSRRVAQRYSLKWRDDHTAPVTWTASGDYEDISYETRHEGIAKITICRPEVHNAFRPQTIIEIGAGAHRCARGRDGRRRSS